jgi:hypothetical protein
MIQVPLGTAIAGAFMAVGQAVSGFFGAYGAAISTGAFIAQGIYAHKAAMKAKRMGADILLQKYGTGQGMPIIYGSRRIGSTVVYMETKNNKELFVVYALAGHELDSFDLNSIQLDGRTINDDEIYRQGYDLSDGTTRIVYRNGSATRSSGTYWGNTSAERTNILGGANDGDNARMTFNLHHGTTSQAADPMLSGILDNWTSDHKLTGIAYIAANYEYDTKGMFSGIPNLSIVVKGKKVYDPRKDTAHGGTGSHDFDTISTYEWSDNAALCLLDYITNDEYGKGLGEADIDMSSFQTAATDSESTVATITHTVSVETASTDTDILVIAGGSESEYTKLKVGNIYTVDDGVTTYISSKRLLSMDYSHVDLSGANPTPIFKLSFEDGAVTTAITSTTSCTFSETERRFHCNGVIDTDESVIDNTKLLISNMRGIFTYTNGKYSIDVEGTETPVQTLTEDHILDAGIQLNLESKEQKYNKVEIEFFNSQKKYETDTAYYTGESSDTFLADDGNEILETRVQFPFVTNQRIAYNHAVSILKRSRSQRTISFLCSPRVLKSRVGEVIAINNTNLDLSAEQYRITNMTIQPDLNIEVTAIEYQGDIYGYNDPPDEDLGIIKDPVESNRVEAPSNFNFNQKSGQTPAYLSWDDSNTYPTYEFSVKVYDGTSQSGTILRDGRTKETRFYLPELPKDTGYSASVVAINSLGIESEDTLLNTFDVNFDPVITEDIAQGAVGGFKFTGSKMYHPVDGSDTGVFETSNVYIDDTGQFSLKDKLSFDGTDLTIDGDITATTGTIGGFSIGNNFLTAGSATSRIKLSTADGIHMGNDTFALAPFNVTKSGQVTATDLILKKGNVTYFDSTDGFSAEAIAQIASSLNTRVQTFAFSSENNTDYATIETTENSQDIKLVVRANASNLQGSGTSEALAIAEIPDNLTIKIEFDDNTGFTSPTTIGSLQTYNASTDGTPLASEYEIETLDLSELGGDFSAFVLGNDGAVNASGDIVYTVSSYTVATAGTYYFRVIYDTTDTSYNATNDPDSFTRSLEIEDLSGSGFLISNGSSGSQTSDAVTLTGTQTITGAKTFSATTTFSGDVNISGDLSVTGTTTTIDTATLNVEDKNITLNYSTGDSSSTANGAGITIQDAVNSTTDATILWDATNDEFDFSHDINVTGTVSATSFSGDGSGLTGVGGTTINNNADNRIITGSGTANTLNGEANLTFDGSTLSLPSSSGVEIDITGTTAGNIRANSDLYLLSQTGTLNLGAGGTNAQISLATNGNATFTGTISSGDITITDTSADPFLKLATSEREYVVRIDNSDSDKFQIRDVTASATRITLNSSGNVGIGETSPDSILHLKNSAPILTAEATNGVSGFRINAIGTTNEMVRFQSSGSTKHTFKANGDFQIGTTTVIDASRNLTNIGTIDATQSLSLNASGTNNTSIELGANTASNHYAFIDLVGDATYTDYGLRIIRNNGGANTSSFIYHRGTGNFNIETQDSASIKLRTAGVDAVTVDSSQRVGIGTSPAYTLDVNGSFAFRSTGYAFDTNFYAYNSGSGTYLRFGNDTATGGILSMTDATNLTIQGQGSGKTTFGGEISGTASYAEFGNGYASASNDGGWHGRLNVAGTSHARIDAYNVSDGIKTTMYAHSGQGAGRIGTISSHHLDFITAGGVKARLDNTNGNLLVGGGTLSATYSASGRGLIEIIGINEGLLALKGGTTVHGYIHGTSGSVDVLSANSVLNLYVAGSSSYRARLQTFGLLLSHDLYPNGSVATRLSHNNPYLRCQTAYGYLDYGPANSSFCHFYTDRSDYYFNTGITVDTGKVQSYNEDLILRRAGSTSHQCTISTTGATFTQNVTAYSDERLKDNIQTLDGSKVFDMRGVSYMRDNKAGSGVIAQEIEKIAPELVHTADDDMGTKSVAYGNLVGYLIEAVKELKAEIEELKK